MHGQKDNDLNAGKNLVFSGQNGAIVLKDSVTQGAGYLEFKDSYTVSAESGKTWTGAGIITDKGTNVTRKVNGVAGDNLHKLGEGTLTINGTGVNQGGLKTGDGTVVLNQQADTAGNVQAFSSVSLASGCPTVVSGMPVRSIRITFHGGTGEVSLTLMVMPLPSPGCRLLITGR